jgi:hypothetical protein
VNLIMTTVDRALIELLIRLDAVTVVLMFIVSVTMIYQTICAWLADHKMRPLALMAFFAALTGWVAMELFQIMVTRAALLSGETAAWFITSRSRIIVPAYAVLLGLLIISWLSNGNRWIIGSAVALVAIIMAWPKPMLWLALTVYRWMATIH